MYILYNIYLIIVVNVHRLRQQQTLYIAIKKYKFRTRNYFFIVRKKSRLFTRIYPSYTPYNIHSQYYNFSTDFFWVFTYMSIYIYNTILYSWSIGFIYYYSALIVRRDILLGLISFKY